MSDVEKNYFTPVEKYEHYKAVAKGEKPTKKNAKKYKKNEQIAYARGQYDARNEARANWKYKNSSPEDRMKYKEERAAKRKAWKEKQAEEEKNK